MHTRFMRCVSTEHGWCVMVKNKDFLVRVNMCETSGIDLIDWICLQ